MQFSPKINKLKFKHQSFALDYSGVANGDLFEKDRTTYTENFLCKIIPGWFGLKSTLIGPSIFSSQPIRMSKTLKHYFYTRNFLYNKIGSLFRFNHEGHLFLSLSFLIVIVDYIESFVEPHTSVQMNSS